MKSAPYRSPKTNSGAVLVEFLLSFILMVIATIGLIDIGTLIFQITSASDAVRWGARKAAITSAYNGEHSGCGDAEGWANSAAQDYIVKSLRRVPNQFWRLHTWPDGKTGARVCTLNPPVHKSPPDKVKLRMTLIQMKAEIKPQKTCLFCSILPIRMLLPAAVVSYVMHESCCDADSDGICQDLPACYAFDE